MSLGVQRWFAEVACLFIQRILPVQLQSWGSAIRNEVAEIQGDGDALRFALESLWGLAPRAASIHLRNACAKMFGSSANLQGGTVGMSFFDDMVHCPRRIGIASALGAVMLGLAYMIIADAPPRYLAINAGALVVGLVILTLLGRIGTKGELQSGATTLVFALVLLATALVGDRVDGAARWIDLGILFVQPSLILLPVMVVGFTHSRTPLPMAGMLIAALALAIQPDRAMAGMLMAGLAALAIFRRDRFAVTAFIGSAIGFAATLAQADTLPAVPFVDQILYSSFDVSFIAGLAVLGGAILLVIPAIIGWTYDMDNRPIYCVFGAVWIAAIAAAAVGNYPTPLVGYSGGAVLGYVLSLMLLPKIAHSSLQTHRTSGPENGDAKSIDQNLRFSVGCPA